MLRSSSEQWEPEDSDNLFARAQAGDQDAWAALFHECYPKVRRAVRRRINGPLRRYVDSTDIANDVFGELIEKADRFQFDTVDKVRAFLFDAAHRRIIDEHRRRQTKKRDSNRERPLSDHENAESDLPSSGPTPSQVAVANEVDEKLCEASDDDAGRLIIRRRSENYNNEEISRETGWSIRKVQRFLERLRLTFQH